MITHLLTSGYSTERWTVTEDDWGGTHEDWSEQIADFAGHVGRVSGDTVHRVGTDEVAVDAILYCAPTHDIQEGDRVTTPDNVMYKVMHVAHRRKPKSDDSYYEVKLELV